MKDFSELALYWMEQSLQEDNPAKLKEMLGNAANAVQFLSSQVEECRCERKRDFDVRKYL